jgi:transcriptional regulator with XRE-family HTH domain
MTAENSWETGLGGAIKVVREDLGMSRKDLAGLAGISYPFLSEIEKGLKQPSSRKLGQLAEALGLKPEELVELSKHKAEGGLLVSTNSPSVPSAVVDSPTTPQEAADRDPAGWAGSTRPEAETDRTSRSGADDRRALDAEIKDAVNVAVSDTLRIWSRDVLPLLVEREVERALAAERSGDDD